MPNMTVTEKVPTLPYDPRGIVTCSTMLSAITGYGLNCNEVPTTTGKNRNKSTIKPDEKSTRKTIKALTANKLSNKKSRRRETAQAETEKTSPDSNSYSKTPADLNDKELKEFERKRISKTTQNYGYLSQITLSPKFPPTQDGIEPNLNHQRHQLEISTTRKYNAKLDATDENTASPPTTSIFATQKIKLTPSTEKYLTTPSPKARVKRALIFTKDQPNIPDISTNSEAFFNYLALNKVNPIWLMEKYFILPVHTNTFKVFDGYLKLHPDVVEAYLFSIDFTLLSGEEKKIKLEKINHLISKKNKQIETPKTNFSKLAIQYQKNELNVCDYVDALLSLEDHHDIKQAKKHLIHNKSSLLQTYRDSLSSLSNEEKAVKFKLFDVFLGGSAFNFLDSDNTQNLAYLNSLITQSNTQEKANIAREILMCNYSKIKNLISSAVFRSQAENTKTDFIKNIDKLGTFTHLLDTFNLSNKYIYSHKTEAIAMQVLGILQLTGIKEKIKASDYLSDNPELIEEFKKSQIYTSLSIDMQNTLDIKLINLISDINISDLKIKSDGVTVEDHYVIERLLNMFSEMALTKASSCFLGGNDDSSTLANQEYINLKAASELLIKNIPVLIEYLKSNLFTSKSSMQQEQTKKLISDLIKQENRELFKSGIMGISLASIFDDAQLFDTTSFSIDSQDDIEISATVSTLLKLPSIQKFFKKLQVENKTMNLSELMMIKTFIENAMKENFLNDNELIDEAIEWYDLILKLEPIYLYKYQQLIDKSNFPDQVIPLNEADLDKVTLGSMILNKIAEIKNENKSESCDIEDILIPTLPSDQIVSFVGAIIRLTKNTAGGNLMDLAFRHHFLRETAVKFKGTALGQDLLLSHVLNNMVLKNETSLDDKSGAALSSSFLTGYDAIANGPFDALLHQIIFNDLLNGRHYSSLTTEQIRGFILGDKIWQSSSSFVPFYQSLKEWSESVAKIRQGETDACTFVRPLVQTASEGGELIGLGKILNSIKKLPPKKRIANAVKSPSASLWINSPQNPNLHLELKTKLTSDGFSQTQINNLITKMEEYNLDINTQQVIICESLDIDITKRVEASGLSYDEYTKVMHHYKLTHPQLFSKKIIKIKDTANLIQADLISQGYSSNLLSKGLAEIISDFDLKGIDDKKARFFIAEQLGLSYQDKLKFTKSSYSTYIKNLSDLAANHPDLINKIIDKTDSLTKGSHSPYEIAKDIVSNFNTAMKVTVMNKLGTDFIKKYSKNLKRVTKSSEFNEVDLLSTAELFGVISRGVFDTIKNNNVNLFYSYLAKGDAKTTDSINLETFTQYYLEDNHPHFFLLKNGDNQQLFFTSYDSTTEERTLFLSSIPDALRELEYEKITDHLFSITLKDPVKEKISEWLKSDGNTVKVIKDKYLKNELFEFLSDNTNLYQQMMNKCNIALENDTLVISGKGLAGMTFTQKGMLSADNLAKYLLGYYPDLLKNAKNINLKTESSALGGFFHSQAQALSNILQIPVIGFNGSESVTFRPLGKMTEFTQKGNEVLFGETKAKIEEINPYFSLDSSPDFFSTEEIEPLKNSIPLTENNKNHILNIRDVLIKTNSVMQYIIQKLATKTSMETLLDTFLSLKETEEELSSLSPFSDIRLIITRTWPSITEANKTSGINHFSILLTYQETEFVIDFSDNKMHVNTKNNWLAEKQKITNDNQDTLIKLEIAESVSDAYFNNEAKGAFEVENGLDVNVLKNTHWYSKEGFEVFIAHNKKHIIENKIDIPQT